MPLNPTPAKRAAECDECGDRGHSSAECPRHLSPATHSNPDEPPTARRLVKGRPIRPENIHPPPPKRQKDADAIVEISGALPYPPRVYCNALLKCSPDRLEWDFLS